MALNRVNWGNYDLVVIDESHNFRNSDLYRRTRDPLSATLESSGQAGRKDEGADALCDAGEQPLLRPEKPARSRLQRGAGELTSKLRSEKHIDEIFRRAQAAFNAWSTLPAQERTAAAILNALDFDFFEVLDSVTIARIIRGVDRDDYRRGWEWKRIGIFKTVSPKERHFLRRQKDRVSIWRWSPALLTT